MLSAIKILFLVIYICALAGSESNILENDGFENPLGPEWLIRTSSGVTIARDTIEKLSGQHSLKVENTSPSSTDYYGCNQRLSAPKAGTQMTLQASIRTRKLKGHAGIDIHFLNSLGTRLPIYDAKITLASSGLSLEWKKYSVDFYIPDETEEIVVALFLKGQGSVWFDELRLFKAMDAKGPISSSGAYVLREPDPLIWFEFADQKVFRETAAPKRSAESTIKIAGARDEWEPFQIVVKPKTDLLNCSIEFTDLVHENGTSIIKKNQFTHYIVGYVSIRKTSARNDMSGLHPDYLLRRNRFDLLAESNNPIWINLIIPKNANPGIYRGHMLLKLGEFIHTRIPLQVTVWDFALPSKSHLYVRSNFWLSLIKEYDYRDNEQILADYYENLKNHRVNAFSTIDLETKIVGDSVVCFFDDFDRKVRILFENYGFKAITVGPFIGDAAGWQYRRKWMGVDPGSARFVHLFRQYCKKLENYLSTNGWIDRCWIGYWDEPQLDDPDFKEIVKIGEIIKEVAPNLKIFMTKWPVPELLSIVDIWCLPFTEQYFHQQDITERKLLGERIFVYHNDPYINTPLIDKRLYAWRYRLADVDGVYAWWNLTFWQKNPYEFPSQVEKKGDTENILRPGDGVLLYPNPDGNGPPVNSLRWEVFRQGLEDYEYFRLLEQAIQGSMKKLSVVSEFSRYASYRINEYLSMMIDNYFDTWNSDVQYLHNIRTRIAEELQTIEQSPIILIKTQPYEGHAGANGTINIMGLTEQGTEVSINNNVVSVNNKGFFNTNIKRPYDGIILIKAKLGSNTKIVKKRF